MKEINSVNNDYIKTLFKLKDKKYRNLNKKFIVEGNHLVEEAYNANCLLTVLTLDNESYKDIETIKVNEAIINKLSSTKNPQNIIGVCKINDNTNLTGSKFLLLDNVNDPGNLGTLVRSSLGFNIDTIVLSNDSVDIYNDKVIRATQGAIFKMNIIYMDLLECIHKLKENNVTVVGTSLKSSYPLKEVKHMDKYAIVLGNEANGVRNDVLDLTDLNVKIEINEKLESLNVAVAGSIIMYYLNN